MEFFSSNRRHISRRTQKTPDMRRPYLQADYEPKEVTCNYYLETFIILKEVNI